MSRPSDASPPPLPRRRATAPSGAPPGSPPGSLPRATPPRAVRAPRPVFRDESGRRWRRVRLALQATLVCLVVLALGAGVMLAVGPDLTGIGDRVMRADDAPAARVAARPQSAAQRAAERRLYAATRRAASAAPTPLPADAGTPADPIVAGFYVNWDDNSRASLARNAGRLDWVVAEWAFVEPDARIRAAVDRRALAIVARLAPAERPRVLAMVTNVDAATRTFDAARLRRLVATPASRAAGAAALAAVVAEHGLGGVTLDFENYPTALDAGVMAFADALRAALRPSGGVVALTIGTDQDEDRAARLAAHADRVFLMLYDEHWYTSATAGPIASRGWFEQQLARFVDALPPGKAIAALGAYGYGWNDATRDVEPYTHQEVLAAARAHGTRPVWDAASGTPYLSWRDPDSTDHVVWYLDAVTAHDQARTALAHGAVGVALWRLGGEDPALWSVLDRRGVAADPAPLAAMLPGYDVQFDGAGELLRVRTRPRAGRRTLVRDPATGRVARVAFDTLPAPWTVERTGATPLAEGEAPPTTGGRRVALTFDDGPDGAWTAPILDTLRAYRVPATFFVIGRQVQQQLGLTRRMWDEGHEIGNHTYTHPDLSRTSPLVTRLELDATNRVLEAVLNRRTVLFRPPYFGDAEPSTADMLEPVEIASGLGFVTAGLHLDSRDWDQPRMSAADIVRETLRVRDARPAAGPAAGHVVLLHDGGGDRRATVAAVGPLIDSLRARGDTLVLLSTLAGTTRDAVMPPLAAKDGAFRLTALATFGGLGLGQRLLALILAAGVLLGTLRLLLVLALAAHEWGRTRRARRATAALDAPPYRPGVTVIVPAYNEARVIGRTIATLLAQDYAGPLEVLVVDDGSPDGTYEVARRAYGDHPRVTVLTKPNGGKSSALNLGLARAAGEVVVALDADTLFTPHTISALVAPMVDARVAAVAGNAKVGNRVNLVTRWQAVEYVTSQNLDRRAAALLDCITVVPGAVGAWRTGLLRAVGGFREDTLAEDQDLTLELRRRGWRVAYAEDAIAYTEAPDTLRQLARQRFRWSYGTLQCMWKHRDALLRRRYGALGLVAMPNVWVFQLGFAALSPLADLALVWSLAGVWITRLHHGATYAATDLRRLLALSCAFVLLDLVAALGAFWMEKGEDRRLAWLVLPQRFAYRQVMYWVVLRSFVAALRGGAQGWGTLERKATVELPTARHRKVA